MSDAPVEAEPRPSVVMPAYEAAETLEVCLEALARQTVPPLEVIVVDGTPDPAPARAICERFPFVRFRTAAPELGAHAKRNLGAEEARGDPLVFTDPDCAADPEWLEALAAAHREGHPAVGGAVACLGDVRNRAIHMVKYPWWLPGGEAGPRPEIPSASTSLTRRAWEAVGPYRTDRWAGDSELSWRLRRAGIPIWFEPRATVTHLDHGPWGAFLRTRYERGRDFGRTRSEFHGWSRGERAARALLFPLVPFVMTARALGFAREAGHLGDWALGLPVQLAANGCWAAGEARALLGAAP